ncbi:Nif3-like dinuclear metal center hexameric protein [Flavimarina sp. Hel_I_48]|uniref:Nif3-like dinuclear metal center hexameric protein n=1 Tax=Flavimarina sp. Hel_I_48 TaxID=1392488 RepID=UPI0004DF4353|nr:Nif3-like dinuclear metal center hexameric protein [Flavimarina sp. Hel_I_48]
MTVQEITDSFEEIAPLAYAEDFDNVGLLVGDPLMEVSGVLVTLDTLETTVEEAITKRCNLIISFHPIIFSGLKNMTGKSYVERVVMRAIKNDIAIFAIHTAFDNSPQGVNKGMCDALQLQDREILLPKKNVIKKLTTYVPKNEVLGVRDALFAAGAGNIGNYDHCSFSTKGHGSFKGNELSNPTVGEKGIIQVEKEVQLNMTYEAHREKLILKALFRAHSYEEVAYETITLENENQTMGMGMTGFLQEPIDEMAFLRLVQKAFNAQGVRHSALREEPINKIAVLGGSGSFAINAAIKAGADALITADLKYHQFYQAEGKILLVDVGHYESEQFTKNLLTDFLKEKFSSFAVILSDEDTNPIKYL